MSNKDIFSFDPFARDIDEQVSNSPVSTGIMSKDVSSDIEEVDSTYDPFSFVDRFAKDLVSLFDEDEDAKEKLKNTYRVDKSLEKQAAKESVLDELVVDYNAAFERGRSLKETMDVVEAQPLLPIGADGVLQSPAPVSRPSSLQASPSGAPFEAPTPQRRPPGLMGKDDESSGYVRLPQFKTDTAEGDVSKEAPIIPELVAPAMASLYKNTPVNLRAFGEYLFKGTLASAFKAVLGSDEKVVEAPTFTERDLADSDMKNLQNIVASKGLGADGLNYKDFGYGGSDSIRDIVASASPTSTVLNSFTDSDLRMASFIGNGDIVVEDGDVFVVDTYDFEPRQKDIYKKYQEGKALTEEEQGVIDNMSIFNRLYHLADYRGKELKSQDDNVRIRLGTVEEVYGDQENASLSFISNSQSEIGAAPASIEVPSGSTGMPPALNPESVTQDVLRAREADNYNTLYGNFETDKDSPVFGYKVTEKTLGELVEFSRPSNTYGKYVKPRLGKNTEARRRGLTSTPMGKYQIVGTTLRGLVKDMRLPADLVFNKETQDAMFLFLARQKMQGKKTLAQKRQALKETWEGFRSSKVTKEQLNQMVSEIESSYDLLDEWLMENQTPSAAPLTSPAPARRGLMSS